MGRTEPTIVKPPPAFRREGRAKRARATMNKVIPALLLAHPRAQRGIAHSELIVDPPVSPTTVSSRDQGGSVDDVKDSPPHGRRNGRRKHSNASSIAAEERYSNKPSKKHVEVEEEREETQQPLVENVMQKRTGPRVSLVVADTLAVAHSLHAKRRPSHGGIETNHASDAKRSKVGILNMASPLEPGGGFLNGATSQEESLCMRTTLLPALRDEFYRLPELGVVYTPDVLVFRPVSSQDYEVGADSEKDILPKNDRWFVDVVSAAMLRLPETEDGRYARAVDREMAVRKMRAVMRVFAARGCTRVVLGAWGCGAYGNPVVEIAEAWRRVLGPSSSASSANHPAGGDAAAKAKKKARGAAEMWTSVVEEVVFAIKDTGLATAFAHAFGEDVMPVPGSIVEKPEPIFPAVGEVKEKDKEAEEVGKIDEEEDSLEVARIKELKGKIRELELQVSQARSAHFKAGLEAVLAGLRKQLPADDDGEERHSDLERDESNDEDEEDAMDPPLDENNGLHNRSGVGIGTMVVQ